MLTVTFALVVLAGPPLKTWSAHVPYAENATITVYPARGLAADTAPCLGDKTLTLIDERCVDVPSNTALLASVAKEPPLKAVATTKADEEGHFKVQVPPGRLYVRIESRDEFTDYVVEPVEGVETTLQDNRSASRRGLAEELASLLDAKAEAAELDGEFWVIGQDNPQVVKLTKPDVDALLDGAFTGPAFFVGCSKVVSAKGRLLGTTCEPEQKRPARDAELELTGQVLLDGKPKAGAMVRQAGKQLAVQTDAKGRFSLWSPVLDSGAMLIAELGELRAAEVVSITWREARVALPLTLNLSREPMPVLRVRDEAGKPLAGASARFWYRGRVHFGTTDARGEVVAPSSLRTSFVSVRSPGLTPFAEWIELSKSEPVVLRRAAPVEVRFRTSDGVLVHPADVRCDGCELLESRPSRDGRVALAADELPAIVFVGPEPSTVTKPGVVVVSSRKREEAATPSKPSKLEVIAEGATLQWSTASGQAEPGRQLVRACAYGVGCETRQVDVPASGTLTIPPPKAFSLEVRTKGFKAGAKMPSYLTLTGPNVQSSIDGRVDRDGVARFERVPAGPWRVSVEYGGNGPWCFAGKPCELDLSASTSTPVVQLKGAVPKTVLVYSVRNMSARELPVQKGAIEVSQRDTVVIDRTSLSADDGGVRVVQLAAPGDVQVTVLDAQRKPVRDALVSVGVPGPYGWLALDPELTNEKGVVVFPKTRPGNLPVRVAKAGFAVATTTDTKAKNEVVLAPGKSLTCRVTGVRQPAEVICSAWFDGGQLEGEPLRGDRVTLRDLPEKLVNVNLEVVERGVGSSWTLMQQVDLAKTNEVTFTVPRKGRVLVVDSSSATVTVEGVGRVFCGKLSEGFCETPPVPPGRVTIDTREGEAGFPFEVPAGEGRVLVIRPEVTP